MVELKLEDLYVTCEKCKGSGQITERSGRMISTGPCDKCSGVGGALTDTGKVLKRFINILKEKGL